MNLFRKGLLQEIEFWREMLLESDLPLESTEYRSMQSALEMVQMRLRAIPEKTASDNERIASLNYH